MSIPEFAPTIIYMASWIDSYKKTSVVRTAYDFAEQAHEGVLRESGDPYFSHSSAVAQTVHNWNLDESSVAAALLHDVLEDTDYTSKDLEKKFGDEIATLVEGLTKLKTFQYGENPNIENLRKLFISFAKDLRVIIIKLADRYHNMETLSHKKPEKQKKIAWETMEIYAPIAYRLGMQKISGELEDLAFPYLYPEEHAWLTKTVKDRYEKRASYAKKMKPELEKIVQEAKVKAKTVDSRAKRRYSLYRKLRISDMDIEKIYDLVALRIIVKTVEDCYAALGAIHKHWPPLPGRIKDYIATPKPNGYRSLHTVVSGPGEKIIEIQIRTEEMHEEAEFGIAAHWAYEQMKRNTKKKKAWEGVRNKRDLVWVRQLQKWQKNISRRDGFLESLKTEFFKERIFVFTPAGDVLDLPAGATPIDFAYHIHSEVGDQCTGAKVNQKIVPLDYELKSGDVVEILTQKGKKTSEDRLKLAISSLARKHIRSALRKKNLSLRKSVPTPTHIEFKIIATDRTGYLKEATSVFSDLKVNITQVNTVSEPHSEFSYLSIRCGSLPPKKLDRILLRLKKIPGTREVNYKHIPVN